MPKTLDQSADNTAVVVRTGRTLLKAVEVKQRTVDAPILYLKLFNDASVTVGSQAADLVIPIPAGRTDMDAQVHKASFSGKFGGIDFSTALTYAVTVLATVSGTAPDAGDEPEVILHWEPVG